MERGFLGSGERGSNHKKKNVNVSAGTPASIGEATDCNREVGFESAGSLDAGAAGVNSGNEKADEGDVNLVTRVDTNVQDTSVRASTSPQLFWKKLRRVNLRPGNYTHLTSEGLEVSISDLSATFKLVEN